MNISFAKKLLFLFFFIPVLIIPEIIEINFFDEIFNHLPPNALVLVDIDNTILEPDNLDQRGSDQWFTHLLKTYAPVDAVNHYCSTVLACPMRLVEPRLAEIFEEIKKITPWIFGFTMRSLVLAPCTIETIQSKGLIFTKLYKNQGFMIDNKYPVLLYEGIIFCQGNKNGITLFTVLEEWGLLPHTIVMIDDKISYLELIDHVCATRGITFIGLHYKYLEAKVKSFFHSMNKH